MRSYRSHIIICILLIIMICGPAVVGVLSDGALSILEKSFSLSGWPLSSDNNNPLTSQSIWQINRNSDIFLQNTVSMFGRGASGKHILVLPQNNSGLSPGYNSFLKSNHAKVVFKPIDGDVYLYLDIPPPCASF